MRKHLLLVLLLAGFGSATACDVCGGGAGNGYVGILPDFQKHIFGLRYRHNSVLTHIGVGGEHTYLTTKESYRTLEAWGGWTLNNKFRLMLSVPYNFNGRENGGHTLSKSGLGDVTLSGYYGLLNKRQSVGDKLLVQSLWAGTGVKLATGQYNPEDKAAAANANLFQLGTGSTDFTLGLMYDVRLQDVGLSVSSNYKLNTENGYGYRYGNKLALNAQGYYKFRVMKKLTLAPNAGVQLEQSDADLDKGFAVSASGGNLLLGTAGVEAVIGKFAVGANLQTPLSQNLANGAVNANGRMMLHVAMAL